MAANDKQNHLIGHNQFPCLYDTSMWGSILASVKEQLPSLDSDSSSSDDEDGELFIFQRDQENLIPDLTEELADDPDIQLLESLTNTGENWKGRLKNSAILEEKDTSKPLLIVPGFEDIEEIQTGLHFTVTEENAKWQKGDPWDFFRSRALIVGPQVAEFPTSTYKNVLTTDNLGFSNLSPSKESDSPSIKAIRKERRKMIEKNILHKEIKESPLEKLNCPQSTKPITHESSESDDIEENMTTKCEGLILRSLEKLEEWDLDKILQNLETYKGQGECTTGATYWKVHPSFKGRESLVSSSQDRLMEKLVALCAKQSEGLPSPHKKPLAKPCCPTEGQRRSRSPWCMPHLSHSQNQDVSKDTKLRSTVEPPTVFIDLRQSEPRKSMPLPHSYYRFQKQKDELSSSDSSTENEEETSERDQKELRERMSQAPRDQTGKSYLLQQLRAFRMGTSQSCGTETKVNTPKGHDTWNSRTCEDTSKSGIRRKQVLTRETQQNTSGRPLGSKCLTLLDQEAKHREEKQKVIRQESRFRQIHCRNCKSSE